MMADKRALVFTGGLGPGADIIKGLSENMEISIAADSGWDLAVKSGIIPDYYIGDMDSINDHEGLSRLPEERVMKYPIDKDYTDTELAIKFLEDRDYRDIVLVGGGGGRIDHLLALIALFNRSFKPVEWFTSTERIVYCEELCEIECRKGQTVSLFSGAEHSIINSDGLKWELENFNLGPDQFSISNTALADHITIDILKGSALVIINF